MRRASIRVTATALALFLLAPLSLQAADLPAFGGSSPFGNGLDAQKIREDLAKMREQLDQNQLELRQKARDARSRRSAVRSTTRSSAQSKALKSFSERAGRSDRQLRRTWPKRNSSGSSSRNSSSSTNTEAFGS